MFDGVCIHYFQVFVNFIFSERSDFFFFDLVVLFSPLFVSFGFSWLAWNICIPNSILISWRYILTSCIRVSNSFLFLMSSLYIRWLIFLAFMFIRWFMIIIIIIIIQVFEENIVSVSKIFALCCCTLHVMTISLVFIDCFAS